MKKIIAFTLVSMISMAQAGQDKSALMNLNGMSRTFDGVKVDKTQRNLIGIAAVSGMGAVLVPGAIMLRESSRMDTLYKDISDHLRMLEFSGILDSDTALQYKESLRYNDPKMAMAALHKQIEFNLQSRPEARTTYIKLRELWIKKENVHANIGKTWLRWTAKGAIFFGLAGIAMTSGGAKLDGPTQFWRNVLVSGAILAVAEGISIFQVGGIIPPRRYLLGRMGFMGVLGGFGAATCFRIYKDFARDWYQGVNQD